MSEKSNKSSVSGGGVGVFGLLGVVFVTLKLLGYVDWSWWWVTAPFWGPLAASLMLMVFILVVVIVAAVISEFNGAPKITFGHSITAFVIVTLVLAATTFGILWLCS